MTTLRPRPRRASSALVLFAPSLLLLSVGAHGAPVHDGGSAGSADSAGSAPMPPGALCGGEDLKLAPPVTDIDGLRAVPVDIQRVDAKVVLDARARTARAEVAVRFRMGPADGYPIFDLRQTIVAAALDGAALSLDKLAHHGFGGGEGAALRVVEVWLPACSDNTLALSYAIDRPASPLSRPIAWEAGAGRVSWDFWFSDLYPGRYLEMWFPANLIYDRFSFTLDLELRGAEIGHTLITNGAVDELSRAHWRVTYPPTSTALSPMLVLEPDDRVEGYQAPLRLADGRSIELDLFKDRAVRDDLAKLARDAGRYVEEFTRSTGPCPTDRLTGYLWPEPRSMEYDGAFTSAVPSLKHELFHTWYGRGVKPARQSDGWIDEAWDVYNTDPAHAFAVAPLDPDALPVTLSPASPWIRTTPLASYTRGPELFAGIAALIGLGRLRDAMSDFYVHHVPGLVTTRELERHLYCTSMHAGVAWAFHRFVYGRPGPALAPSPGECASAE
jgi:hypothetical protein